MWCDHQGAIVMDKVSGLYIKQAVQDLDGSCKATTKELGRTKSLARQVVKEMVIGTTSGPV